MQEPQTEQTGTPEDVTFAVYPTRDDARAAGEEARAQGNRCLFYKLRDGHSYLVMCLTHTYAIGQSGRGEWEEHRFFQPDQEDEANQLAEALKGLEPFNRVGVFQTKRLCWGVYAELSNYWQELNEIHPRYEPHPTPYSRVLTPEMALELPLWYESARRTGYQTLVFKVGRCYQVVHVPKDLDLGERGQKDWDTRFFFEEGIKAEHFAQCLRMVEGIQDAVVNSHRSRGVPRRWLWVVIVTPANAP